MIVPVFIIFALLTVCLLASNKRNEKFGKRQGLLLGLLVLVLCAISALKSSDTPDYPQYEMIFQGLSVRIEPGDAMLVKIISNFTRDAKWFFFVFALVSVTIRVSAIKKMAPFNTFLYAALALYVSNIYILQDMIQIRVAIATAFFLWAIYFKLNHKLWLFITSSVMAVMFHYTAIVILPIWFLSSEKVKKGFWMWIIPASYVVSLLFSSFAHLAGQVQLEAYQQLFNMYEGRDDSINIFNMWQLLRIGMFYYLLANMEKIAASYPGAKLLLKVYAIGIISIPLFRDIPAVAFRISELFMVAEILLLPTILFIRKRNQSFMERLALTVIGGGI